MRIAFGLLPAIAFAGGLASTAAQAQQNMCRDDRTTPRGTVAACGTAPGYYRPQPYTMSARGVPERAPPGSWYAPSGPRQQDWNQYNSKTGTYGPREPNPYDERGRLSPPRAVKHLYTTRVQPRYKK